MSKPHRGTWGRGYAFHSFGSSTSMKAKVYRNLMGSEIEKRASPVLREKVAMRRFGREVGLFTLLVFRMQRQNNVPSGAVAQALREIPESERIVAFAGCFTVEAKALLAERAAEIYELSEYPWTDTGVLEIRDFISSSVKFPR